MSLSHRYSCKCKTSAGFIEAFLRSYDSAPRPPLPTPSPVRKLQTHRKTEKERQFVDGRGREGTGVEPNHTIARQLRLL